MKLLIATVMFIFLWPQSAEATEKTVSILLTHDRNEVSVPTVELYRQIISDAEKSDRFLVVPMEVTRKNMRRPRTQAYGAMPVFDRRHLLKAHPPARSYTQKRKRHRRESKRMIAQVQSLVDTLAIDGALIVDCATEQSGNLLQGCSLSYYDRSRGQVTGSVAKSFRVGIRDATRWSHILVGDLASGMTAERNRREKESIRKALSRPQPKKDDSRYLAEIQAGGQDVADEKISFGPQVGVWLGKRFDDFSFGIVGSASTSERSHGKFSATFEERSYGLGFGVSSRAMVNVEWDLGLILAVAERDLRVDYAEPGAPAAFIQSNRDLRLSLSPGMMWRLSKSTAWGLGVAGNKYFGLSSEVSGNDAELRMSGVGMNLRFRALF